MQRRGEVREAGRRSVGGRPATVYEYNGSYGIEVRIEIRRRVTVVDVAVQLRDLLGRVKKQQRRSYASLESNSLDGWLDDMLRDKKVERIGLFCAPSERCGDLREHLEKRYHCCVEFRSIVCLTDGEEEGELVLYFPIDGEVECAQWSGDAWRTSGRPDLLPLPAVWTEMDHTDHTLVEEMVARIVQITACILSPPRIILYADFWNPRLMKRILFNADSKLRGVVPPLLFRRVGDKNPGQSQGE